MNIPGRTDKLHCSLLTVVTCVGFIVVCGIFIGYALLIQQKIFGDVQYLREENKALLRRNQELETKIPPQHAEQTFIPNAPLPEETPDADRENVGQRSFRYTVKKGDNIWNIAAMYNVSVDDLIRWNNLTPRPRIFPGDQLTIILEERATR